MTQPSVVMPTRRGRPKKTDGVCTRLKWHVCSVCTRPFPVARSPGSRQRQDKKTCSDECRGVLRKRLAPVNTAKIKMRLALNRKNCKACGTVFTPTSFTRKYCSKRCNDCVANRKRRRYAKPGRSSVVVYNLIYDRDHGVCQLCGKKVNAKYSWPDIRSGSMDHIVPLSVGGEHSMKNIQLAHLGCNLSKHNRGGGQMRLF